jgi:hypothetical protein
MKARSAITLGGHHPDAVTWFDTGKGEWLTSNAYTLAGVPFVRRFVDANKVTRYFGRAWEKSMPESAYKFVDDDPVEKPVAGWSPAFPHELKGEGKPEGRFFEHWRDSPFADDYLGEMARDAVDRLKLGQKNRTDVLAVSFSVLDAAGHDFGPRSHEVQDVLYRLDITIGRLLDHLDKALGANSYVVALSADHGVATIPEHLQAEGTDAGRVIAGDVKKVAEATLQAAQVSYTDIYFEPGVREKLEASPEASRKLKDALAAVAGVGWVISSAEMQAGRESPDHVIRAAALSNFPSRSGDWVVVPKQNWFFRATDATTHGTTHWYDARVPIIFYGFGIRSGKYSDQASPADIAPTLAHLLGFRMPAADGKVQTAALLPSAMHAAGSGK